MDRNVSAHPSAAVIASGVELTDAQLDALTPEQRERLTSGEPLPIDPRSPLVDQADEIAAGAVVVDDWTAPAVEPEHIEATDLTVDGAPVDPDAGGDATGDGHTGVDDERTSAVTYDDSDGGDVEV